MFGEILQLLTVTLVDLTFDLCESAGDVGSVTIQYWTVAVRYFTRVIHNNDLGVERAGVLGGVLLRVRGDESSTKFPEFKLWKMSLSV